jgi:cytochrome c
VDRGKSISKACISFHTLEKGGANKVGPNLWGVIDRSRASEPGYDYSAAMKSRGGKWTFEDLDKFLAHPQSYVAGTNMTYSRIQDPERRADLIGYLRTLPDNPVSLPTAPEKASPSGTREARRKIATAVFDDRVSASVFCLIHA